ncbi:hypothetical protein MMC17_003315 [Xylographa soralifera]|nr:hypothetical protein [Xylographa soralifera]
MNTEPTSFPAVTLFSNLTMRTVSRVIMGEELCRNKDFLKVSQAYFQGNFLTGVILLKLPLGVLRSVFAWPIAFVQRRKLRQLIGIISPVVKKRMQEQALSTRTPRVDAIEWTIKQLNEHPISPNGSKPLWRISSELIQNLWASGASPGAIITQMLFHILEDINYLEPLRQEAEHAIAKHGWSEKIINDLPLQDSFIREVNRLHPVFTLNCTRTIMREPFEFSDGLKLPVGTRIGFPAGPSQQDPDHFENPLQFDGFRFVKLTQADVRTEDKVNRWVASHVGATNLIFGYGNHVCPGRFFAIRLIKIVFTKLITEYDISWDRTQPGQPPRFKMEGLSTPNPSQRVFLKRRML